MSVLEAVVSGPVYSSKDHFNTQQRYSISYAEIPPTLEPMDLEVSNHRDFFEALKRELRFSLAEALSGVLGFLKPVGLPHDLQQFTSLKDEEFVRKIGAALCHRSCSADERRRLKDYLIRYLADQKKPFADKTNLFLMTDRLSVTRQAYIDILSSPVLSEEERLSNYYSHLMETSRQDYAQLFLADVFPTPITRQGLCVESEQCAQAWRDTSITPQSNIQRIRWFLENARIAAAAVNAMELTDENVAQFYRFSPDLVIRVYARYVGATSFHCKYLHRSLLDMGNQSVRSEIGNSLSYLSPLTALWLMGTGLSMFKGFTVGMSKALSTLAVISTIDLIWRFHQIQNQERASEKLVTWNLGANEVDREQMAKFLALRESIRLDRRALNVSLGMEIGSLLIGGIVGKVLLYGTKNLFRSFADPIAIYRNIVSKKSSREALRRMGLSNEDEFIRWVKGASDSEKSKMLGLVDQGLAVSVLGFVETIDAFFIGPYMRPATGNYDERVDY